MTRGLVHEASVSGTVEWYTPGWVFEILKLNFDVDVCSPGKDVVPWITADRHIKEAEDGLLVEWGDFVWMNHPYGNRDMEWVDRFIKHKSGVGVCHARTDTPWCKRLMQSCDLVVFTKRIQFVDATGKPPLRMNKQGKMVKSGPGCGQMLFACGDEGVDGILRACYDDRLAGRAMRVVA